MKKISMQCVAILVCCMLFSACADERAITMQTVLELVKSGATAPGADNRVLLVDVRSGSEYLGGHIADALSVPLDMIAEGADPLYTNGYNEVSATAATGLG